MKKDIELVLAFGGVEEYEGEYYIGGEALSSINKKIKNLKGENILLKAIIASKIGAESIKF